MTIVFKTFSRARSAKAALVKILNTQGVEAEIKTTEVSAGRFVATAHFAAAPAQAVADVLHTLGFDYGFNEPEIVEAPVADDAAAKKAAQKAARRGVSTIMRPCDRVHMIATSMVEENPSVARKDIMAACMASGITFYTARTQIQVWFANRK